MQSEKDFCAAKHCRNESDIFYYKVPLCDKHWKQYSELPVNKLKDILNINTKEEKNGLENIKRV